MAEESFESNADQVIAKLRKRNSELIQRAIARAAAEYEALPPEEKEKWLKIGAARDADMRRRWPGKFPGSVPNP